MIVELIVTLHPNLPFAPGVGDLPVSVDEERCELSEAYDADGKDYETDNPEDAEGDIGVQGAFATRVFYIMYPQISSKTDLPIFV
jgi:hypothetical protein